LGTLVGPSDHFADSFGIQIFKLQKNVQNVLNACYIIFQADPITIKEEPEYN
jgi:hypothetical protein